MYQRNHRAVMLKEFYRTKHCVLKCSKLKNKYGEHFNAQISLFIYIFSYLYYYLYDEFCSETATFCINFILCISFVCLLTFILIIIWDTFNIFSFLPFLFNSRL